MLKKAPQTIYLEKETKNKLKYVSYKTDKSQSKVINEALSKHLEEELKLNPGYMNWFIKVTATV